MKRHDPAAKKASQLRIAGVAGVRSARCHGHNPLASNEATIRDHVVHRRAVAGVEDIKTRRSHRKRIARLIEIGDEWRPVGRHEDRMGPAKGDRAGGVAAMS